MSTEFTDRNGWVLYDGDCAICAGLVRRFGPALERRGFDCVPLKTRWARERLRVPEGELLREMRVLDRSGAVTGGAAAMIVLARSFWWARPLVWLARMPGGFSAVDAAYRWFAARRSCANGACRFGRRTSALMLLALPLCIPFVLFDAPGWLVMWATAGGLWLALKCFTYANVKGASSGRALAYLLAWPGMDAEEFFRRDAAAPRPTLREWIPGLVSAGCGLGLIYAAAPAAYTQSALLAGWVGMAGIVLVLHFGVFKCLALFWRRLGIPATPIMRAPLRAQTLSEFWGRRWNTGFSIPARRYLMEPLAKRFGTTAALVLVFLVSGIVHELVISVPARAGYGLPTLYFLIQALGMVWERRRAAGPIFMFLSVAGPAFILFHPPFVDRVMVPFLKAINAL